MRSSAVVAVRYIVLGLGAITVLIPFLWQISTSLKDDTQINAVPAHFWPNPIVWGNYKDAYTLLPFNLFFLNTVLVEIGSLAAIFIFIGQWHDFLAPLIYLNTEKHFTLALGINQYIQQERGAVTHWGLVMAASMSIIAPPLVLFLFFQRFFIEGITLGGLKG
jgi:ABC-type glycerol-3-phosphate transport system permease component